MLNRLREILKGDRKIFHDLCRLNNLELDFEINKNEINVLMAIFESREYADYFPFYREANIIDIGAHYGYFSIFASNNTDVNSRVIAVEPGKTNFTTLNKNIERCGIKNISSFNIAVGGKNGLLKLYLGKSTNHSLLENYALLNAKTNFEEVEVKTLETLIIEGNLDRVDFLKLDCEGAEYEILENTPAHIFERIETISMEFHDRKDGKYTGEKLIRILKENHFDIVKYQYDKTTMNLNYGKIIGTKLFKKQ